MSPACARARVASPGFGALIAALERVGPGWRFGSEARDGRTPADIDCALLTLARYRLGPQRGTNQRCERIGAGGQPAALPLMCRCCDPAPSVRRHAGRCRRSSARAPRVS